MIKTINWSQLSPEKKKMISAKKSIFIFGSVEMSSDRIKKLANKIIKKHDLIWGVLDDKYIQGFDNCPQFKTLAETTLKKALSQLKQTEQNKITILSYKQKYSHYIIKELKPAAVVLINGSWQKAFHYTKNYFFLNKFRIPYKFLSPFINEDEAIAYAKEKQNKNTKLIIKKEKKYSDKELMNIAKLAAKQSFDHTFQTGAVLAKKGLFLLATHNKVVPYSSYARHHGCQKEKELTPPQDLNFFDTNHAEVELLVQAQEQKIDFKNTTLFINLLPCPTCARMISQTQISKIVYQRDHSSGYAYKLLKMAGKEVRRL